jgi:dephospho-CoA kinase
MKIGVTGNYASGKGTVCDIFASYGAVIIDTDIIAREIVVPGSDALMEISREFGTEFINKDGTLNRRTLGSFVFENEERVKKLNNILHPKIFAVTLARSSDDSVIYMINAPVLFESGFDLYMDAIIVVSADIDQSIQRGTVRDGIDPREAEKRLSFQISLNEKIHRADYVIDNSQDIDFTRKQVCEIWNNLTNRKIGQ